MCEYLASQTLRRDVHEGLKVVENWNRANTVLLYGKDSELTGADREHQEVAVLALHLLQSALVHGNTLLDQRVLADGEWAPRLTDQDRRGLSPLFANRGLGPTTPAYCWLSNLSRRLGSHSWSPMSATSTIS